MPVMKTISDDRAAAIRKARLSGESALRGGTWNDRLVNLKNAITDADTWASAATMCLEAIERQGIDSDTASALRALMLRQAKTPEARLTALGTFTAVLLLRSQRDGRSVFSDF